MKISPLAGKPAEFGMLIDVDKLVSAYHDDAPDPTVLAQRVAFGTSGHRGCALSRSFNEAHILAITQAICCYRDAHGINGPLFLGYDTHALSAAAYSTATEVLAANGVELMLAVHDEFTPTPVISHAILTYNQDRSSGLADGIVITPSHNPPQDGGFKYNARNGGPADTDTTTWIEDRANAILEGHLAGVRRLPLAVAIAVGTTHRHDYLNLYVADLENVVDMDIIGDAKLRLAVDPLGGAGVHYWGPIADRYGLDLTVVNQLVDPTFRFMSLDRDGQIRMDPSSPFAMQTLLKTKDRFDLSFACDPDHDRHGIVAKSGLISPNHFLCAAISYLFQHRPKWCTKAKIGKTVVTTSLIDRLAVKLGRALYECPVGFKWFTEGLLDASLGFGGEESAGATFLRRDGNVWTTDKDGIVPCLLAAEMTARTGDDPVIGYRAIARELGSPASDRIDAAASRADKAALASLTASQFKPSTLGGESIQSVITVAPGNGVPIGGLKVITKNGWFAARPSGTEAIYRIYAESFSGDSQLRNILEEAQTLVGETLATLQRTTLTEESDRRREPTETEAVAAWENEGDPN